MNEDFEDGFAEEDGGDLETIQEQPEDLDRREENPDLHDDEDEAKKVVKPKKRVLRPMIKLDATRLFGPRGVGVLESTFKDIKFKGKGHELEDLDKTMSTLEHWAHRLFPKMTFDDCIDKIEDLGMKKNVIVGITKIRLGMDCQLTPEIVEEISDEEREQDPFDQLIGSAPVPSAITEEQRACMERNRRLAQEIRARKIKEREEALKTTFQSSLQPDDKYISPSEVSLS